MEIKQVDWDEWLYPPGMPAAATSYDMTLASAPIEVGKRISKSSDVSTWGHEDFTKWQMAQWVLLVDTLLSTQVESDEVEFQPAHLDAIDAFTNHFLTTSNNAELRFRWYRLSLGGKDTRQSENIARFLGEQGRMMYVRPLFRDVAKHASLATAQALFATTRDLCHPICVKMVERDLSEAQRE